MRSGRNPTLAWGTDRLYMNHMARSTTYSALRANLKKACDDVCADHEPLRIERKNGDAVVLISESDFTALDELAYLLRSPENARRLLSALHADRNTDKAFTTADELRSELGLGR